MSLPSKNSRSHGWILTFCLLSLLLIQSIALTQPRSPQPPDDASLFSEGEVLLSRGETEKALWRFKWLLTDFPKSSLSNEARFRMAVAYTQLKRPKDAIRTLNELLPTFLSPQRMVHVFTLLGDNHLALEERFTALHWYGKGLLVPGQPVEDLKRKVRLIVDSYDTDVELNQIEALYRGTYAGGYAKLKRAQLAKRRGNDSQAKRIFSELEKEYRGADYGSRPKEPLELAPPSAKAKYTVGVILPLSGVNQNFGERVLQATQFAMKEIESQGKTPLISLVIRDSKGNPLEAERAVEELATREKAFAIIGPLLSITTEKATRKAQQLKVPLLTLSQKEPVGKGEFIFQNSMTPSDQVQALLDFAVKELELRTFAIFYTNSPYGTHFKTLFTQEAVRRGGKVLGSVVYQEDQTDFGQEIKGFFRIESIQAYDSRRKKNEEFKAGLSVDGLFIPDSHDRVSPILSQMAYYDLKGVTFLGTSAWNHPGLLSLAGKSAEGATFVDAFFKGSPSPLVARFVEEFRRTYRRDPETIEALAYDATRLLREILLSKTVSSPSQLREELHQVRNFQGVSSLKGFGEDGKALRTLPVLRVNKGQIEQVTP